MQQNFFYGGDRIQIGLIFAGHERLVCMLSRFLKKTKTVASLLSLQLPNTHLHCIKVCPWFCILCTSFPTFKDTLYLITLFEIFIFCPKIQLWFPKKIVDFFGEKTRENVVVLGFLPVDNFDFTRKIWVKNSWKCRVFFWIFGQKFDFSDVIRQDFQCESIVKIIWNSFHNL